MSLRVVVRSSAETDLLESAMFIARMIRLPRNVSWMKLRRHSHEWPSSGASLGPATLSGFSNNDDGLPRECRGQVQNVSTVRVESRGLERMPVNDGNC